MPRFHWYLPTSGDGGAIGATNRAATLAYLAEVARVAEHGGFAAVLVPAGAACPDPWIVASALAPYTHGLRFVVAVRGGLTPPAVLAEQAASFQRCHGDRLALSMVTGGDAQEQRAYGDFLNPRDRYGRTAEYLEVLRLCWRGEPVEYWGDH